MNRTDACFRCLLSTSTNYTIQFKYLLQNSSNRRFGREYIHENLYIENSGTHGFMYLKAQVPTLATSDFRHYKNYVLGIIDVDLSILGFRYT